MTDCLLIGFNDSNFESYVKIVSSMGTDSGAYRDLNLSFIEFNNRPYRALDMLTYLYPENRDKVNKPFHNQNFLSPTILYLGSYLSKRGFTFDYINLFQLEKEKLKDKLINDPILTIAITTTFYVSINPILEIISFIKEYNNKAKIIIGGPFIDNQVTSMDRESVQGMFKYIDADFYVISPEGEFALSNILQTLKENSNNFNNIDNIAYIMDDGYCFTERSIEANSLEENQIDYNLFPQHEIGEFLSVRTAKSCPFACAYCGFPKRAGKYIYLSPERVEAELNAIRDIGQITTLTFLDDTFNVPRGRLKSILKMIIKNGYHFKWNCYFRADHSDDEMIELMKEAGCEGVFLGVESGSDLILKKMNKKARRKDYLQAIPKFKEVGITTHANLLVGFPGETDDTVHETVELIEETGPDFFRAQLWYCDPVTPIWQKKEEYGINGYAFNWSHNTMDYKTACDLIDEKFFFIKNSTWLPQSGFEFWSAFYLQRKGMTMDGIKGFVRTFNKIVEEQLINPDKKDVEPHMLELLRQYCDFKNPHLP